MRNTEPRKGTETLWLHHYQSDAMIEKHRTPEGDGNQFRKFQVLIAYLIEKHRTPEGDGNIPTELHFAEESTELRNTEPRKGTETLL